MLSRWLKQHQDPPTSSSSFLPSQPHSLQSRRSRGYGKVLPYGLRGQLRLATLSLHFHGRQFRFDCVDDYDDNQPPLIPRSHARYYHFHDDHVDTNLSPTAPPKPKKSHGRPFKEGAIIMTRDEFFRKNKSRGYTDDHYDRYVARFYRDVCGVDLVATLQQPTSENVSQSPLSL